MRQLDGIKDFAGCRKGKYAQVELVYETLDKDLII
jgi:hypothetical protein